MSRTRLPAELCELVEKVARHPHGLGFLHQTYLESVAVTLEVHPFVVDAARAYLETAEGRAVMIEEVRRARERQTTGETGGTERECGDEEELVRDPDPGELIAAAERHPLGSDFLLHAPPETVAVTFQVHPFVVFRARSLMKHREARAKHGRP